MLTKDALQFCVLSTAKGMILKMKQFFKNNITLICSIIMIILLYFFKLKSICGSIILFLNLFGIIYVNGYYRYLCYKNQKNKVAYTTRKLFHLFPIYDVSFIKKTKVQTSDYLMIYFLLPIALLLFNIIVIDSSNDLSPIKGLLSHKTQDAIYLVSILSSFLIILSLFNDIKIFFTLIKNYKALFIEVKGFTVKICDEKNYKYHHKSIVLMERNYEDYSILDLKREKYHLEGTLERAKKPAFYDVYVLPLIILLTSGIFSIINSFIIKFIIEDGNSNTLKYALGTYMLFAAHILLFVLYISFIIRKASYNSIQDLKSRILVIDDLIDSKKEKR